jgi:catechol 2,3-dioxygenase-like lactoylglutathione lyase family enzyme
MALDSLDHFFIYAHDLEASRGFYERVLGLEVGYRPPFGFDGYWLYLGGRAVVHLGTGEPSPELEYYLGQRKAGENVHTGALDHIAFRCTAFQEFRARLDADGIGYRHRVVPDMRLDQLFIKDPDGLTIELNFFPEA